MLDTSPAARTSYYRMLAALSPARRLELAAQSSRAVRRLAEAGILKQFPGADPEELKLRLAVRLYGRELVERFVGRLPADAR